jgi:hypothetical protein
LYIILSLLGFLTNLDVDKIVNVGQMSYEDSENKYNSRDKKYKNGNVSDTTIVSAIFVFSFKIILLLLFSQHVNIKPFQFCLYG